MRPIIMTTPFARPFLRYARKVIVSNQVFLLQCRDCDMALLMILGPFMGFVRRCADRRTGFSPDVANRSSREVITHHAEDPPALVSNRALWLRPQTQC